MAAIRTATTAQPTIIPPRLVRINDSTDDDLECSLHYLPKPLLREFGHVFSDEHLKFGDGSLISNGGDLALLAVPTNQRAREDLVAVGDHIETEKDRLLNVVSYSYCLNILSLGTLIIYC